MYFIDYINYTGGETEARRGKSRETQSNGLTTSKTKLQQDHKNNCICSFVTLPGALKHVLERAFAVAVLGGL